MSQMTLSGCRLASFASRLYVGFTSAPCSQAQVERAVNTQCMFLWLSLELQREPNHASIFKTSAYVMPANISLAKNITWPSLKIQRLRCIYHLQWEGVR